MSHILGRRYVCLLLSSFLCSKDFTFHKGAPPTFLNAVIVIASPHHEAFYGKYRTYLKKVRNLLPQGQKRKETIAVQGKAVKGQPAKKPKPKPKPDPNPNVIKITNKEQLQKLKGTKLNEQMKAWGVPIGKGEAALVDAKRARLVAKFEQEEAKKMVRSEERKEKDYEEEEKDEEDNEEDEDEEDDHNAGKEPEKIPIPKSTNNFLTNPVNKLLLPSAGQKRKPGRKPKIKEGLVITIIFLEPRAFFLFKPVVLCKSCSFSLHHVGQKKAQRQGEGDR
jgi:hypothetical protein